MEIELPKLHQSQQDMDLIDILWRQDIDLGAGREVFDYSHRQKEHELEKRRKLEEEKQEQLLKEQEKALLSQLQLDEETGEFVPRPPQSTQPETTTAPTEAPQNVLFSEEEGESLSFDECMQLLAETFPLVEDIQPSTPSLDSAVTLGAGSSQVLMAPHQPQQVHPSLLTSSLPEQKTVQDLEQAWQELLSIPELQQCLSMPLEDMTDLTGYTTTNKPPELQNANYNYYMSNPDEVGANTPDTLCPSGFLNTFENCYTNLVPPENLNQMTLNVSDLGAAFNTDNFCDVFYPDLQLNSKAHGNIPPASTGNSPQAEVQSGPPPKPMDITEFTPGDGFENSKPQKLTEFHDSDSGLSMDSSPNAASPQKSSIYGDTSFGYSDSDLEEMDSDSGSSPSEHTEMFPMSYHMDGYQVPPSTPPQAGESLSLTSKLQKKELPASPGHSKPPFTKDKQKSRAESRLSRDEQRAKALQIPFSVDKIINLPVDDFNEMMSKQQLTEAQLALIRDIRRRGKNKVAAQNCRKRKMENIVGLEYNLDSLKEEKERLLKEKGEHDKNIRQMKQQLNSLYLEVFGMLRDEDGKPYSPSEYSLQQTSDGSVFLVPRSKKTVLKKEVN
ncbi:nuclear factor erythroid 2-related factor 2a isoform X1 [Lepisosteus oculatus]|uniref:nuclear factor erythroid 2-related factor 2a isoform X1 n=2 Tax=Lepisosteus oculatus TaxID=7918 RepID=UPI0003EAB9BD|nr:PREDICTED: nuclear factor erythroid 2-related factor 2 isoform X1 [Lepisosteus oculatus]